MAQVTEEAAADVTALADQLGWDRFSLIGHSMGGKIIQHVLLQHPHAAENPGNRATIIDITTGSRLTPVFVNSIARHSLENSTVAAFGAYLPSWGKADFSGQVKGNPAPVKVIVGEHDPALGAETPVALATVVEEHLSRG
jgi:alpha/beta hydrolase fold